MAAKTGVSIIGPQKHALLYLFHNCSINNSLKIYIHKLFSNNSVTYNCYIVGFNASFYGGRQELTKLSQKKSRYSG